MQLIIDTPTVTLSASNGAFHIENTEGTQRKVSCDKITSIAIAANDCLLRSDAIELAAEKNIPIFFLGKRGEVSATLRSPHFVGLADVRRKQALFLKHQDAISWLIELFAHKIEGQLNVLGFLKNRKPSSVDFIEAKMKNMRLHTEKITALKKSKQVLNTEFTERLMGLEGNIARDYWDSVSFCLPEMWQFETRSRQPALDAFNATLNYLYGMLYPVIESGLFAAGLDPYLGILHADQYDAPTLAFDCIEPFRPWIDELIITQFLTNQVMSEMYSKEECGVGVILNHIGKRFWIPLFNDYLKANTLFREKRVSRQTQMYRFAGELANRLKNLEL